MPENNRIYSQTDRGLWPPSPCTLVCTLDQHNVCLGCDRTLEQIRNWSLMNRDEQWAVIDTLKKSERGN